MQTEGQFQQLPLELLELIAAYSPAQSYCNLRETCRNAANLSPVARLNFAAFKESAKGWTADDGRNYKPLHSCLQYDEFALDLIQEMYAKDKCFMDNLQC